MSAESLELTLGRYNLNRDTVEIYVQESSGSVDEATAEGVMTPNSSGSEFRAIDFSSIGGLPDTFDTLVIYSRDSTHSNPDQVSKLFLSELTVEKAAWGSGGAGGSKNVPEPATLGLLGLGLGIFGFYRVRRRAAARS
jgi:hypothetical protein